MSARRWLVSEQAASALEAEKPSRWTEQRSRQQLLENIEALHKMIIGHVAYVDTVQVLTRDPVTSSAFRELRSVYTRHIESWRSKAFMWGVRLHQPRLAVLECVAKRFPNHIVCRFDVALDLITRSVEDSHELQQRLMLMTTQPWRGRRETASFEASAYYARARTTRNLVLYADRPSKLIGAPACHLEFRYSGAEVCRARGVRQVADLPLFQFGICLERDMRFSVINWKMADKLIGDEARWTVRSFDHRRARSRRRYWHSLNHVSVRKRIQRMIRVQLSEEELLDWEELAGLPTQDCIDAAPLLAKAAVHLPGRTLIKPTIRIIWS